MDAKQSLEQSSQDYTIEDNELISYAQKRFYASELCSEARKELQALVDNPEYSTGSSQMKGNPLPFIDRHLHHLSMYPKTNLNGYISNLKLMTRAKHQG